MITINLGSAKKSLAINYGRIERRTIYAEHSSGCVECSFSLYDFSSNHGTVLKLSRVTGKLSRCACRLFSRTRIEMVSGETFPWVSEKTEAEAKGEREMGEKEKKQAEGNCSKRKIIVNGKQRST